MVHGPLRGGASLSLSYPLPPRRAARPDVPSTLQRFALECYQCRTPIASADYLPLSDPLLPPRASYRHPSTRFYHPLHFFCAGCGDPFVDPVSYELQGAAELEACPYVARDGHPYCDRCDLRMWRPKCAGCRKGLREEDGFLEVEGDKWHEGCFQCSVRRHSLLLLFLPVSMKAVEKRSS